MNTILGVKFREYGQIYYFLAGDCSPSIGSRVIVETEQGQGIGEVVIIRDTLPTEDLLNVAQQNEDSAGSCNDFDGLDTFDDRAFPEPDGLAMLQQRTLSMEKKVVQSSVMGQGIFASLDASLTKGNPTIVITNTVASTVVMPNEDLSVADIPRASAVLAHAEKLAKIQREAGKCEGGASEGDAFGETSCDASLSESGNSTCGSSCGVSCGAGDSLAYSAEKPEKNLDGIVVACSDDMESSQESALETATHTGRMVSYDGSAGEHSSDAQGEHEEEQPLSFDDLRPILRIATDYDLEHAMSNELLSREASSYCKECIKARDLDMKLVDVEVFFDLSKFIFYFTAPSRIDFRELVKDLVKHYRTRIELRQIGVRHETQMIGAVGNCGMVCCCRRFLRKFAPVTIKMAKEQNLFLNPAKISGICGRLLCCLSYEQENYEEFHRRCPRLGKKYMTSKGPVKVMRANMFRNSLIAYSETGEELEIPLEEWQEMDARRPDGSGQSTRAVRRDKGEPKNEAKPDNAAQTGHSDKQRQAEVKTVSHAGCAGKGSCEECGDCGPSSSHRKQRSVAELNQTTHKNLDSERQANPVEINASSPQKVNSAAYIDSSQTSVKASHGDAQDSVQAMSQAESAEQIVASLGGAPVHEAGEPSARFGHAMGTTLSALGHGNAIVSPASVAADVIAAAKPRPYGDSISVAEAAAKLAPASIALAECLIKSTDASALKTSRGRRKRRRKSRDDSAFTGDADQYGDQDAEGYSESEGEQYADESTHVEHTHTVVDKT